MRELRSDGSVPNAVWDVGLPLQQSTTRLLNSIMSIIIDFETDTISYTCIMIQTVILFVLYYN